MWILRDVAINTACMYCQSKCVFLHLYLLIIFFFNPKFFHYSKHIFISLILILNTLWGTH